MLRRIDIDVLLKSIAIAVIILLIFRLVTPVFALCQVEIARNYRIIKPTDIGPFASCYNLLYVGPPTMYGGVRCVNDTIIDGGCGPGKQNVSEKSICEPVLVKDVSYNIRRCVTTQIAKRNGTAYGETYCDKTVGKADLHNAKIVVQGGDCDEE